jgi:hypothetical protein
MKSNIIILLTILVLTGCSSPNSRIAADLKEIERQEFGNKADIQVLSLGPGEGDSSNVYYLVDLRVTAKEALSIAEGPFKGLALEKGEGSSVLRLSLLYQWLDGSWQLSRTSVEPAIRKR